MAPRQQSKSEQISADSVSVASGSFLSADRGMDLLVKLSGLERSATYMEAHAQETDKKLDTLRIEFASAKGSVRTLVWICGIVGTILVSLTGFAVYVAEQIAKHYLHW